MIRDISVEELAQNVNNPMFADDALGVVFYSRTVEDAARTLVEGRRCFKERTYVKIMVPGDRHNIIDRPIQKTGILPTDDALRFPRQFLRFQQRQQEQAHDGTPLTLWPTMPGPLAEELKFLNIFTVEQLATLADTHVAKIHGGAQWKQKASDFVAALKDSAQLTKLQTALQDRDNEVDTLKKALKDQGSIISSLQKRLDKLEK